jgi:hypothetical protein
MCIYREGSVVHQKIIGLTIELKGSEKGLQFLNLISYLVILVIQYFSIIKTSGF